MPGGAGSPARVAGSGPAQATPTPQPFGPPPQTTHAASGPVSRPTGDTVT